MTMSMMIPRVMLIMLMIVILGMAHQHVYMYMSQTWRQYGPQDPQLGAKMLLKRWIVRSFVCWFAGNGWLVLWWAAELVCLVVPCCVIGFLVTCAKHGGGDAFAHWVRMTLLLMMVMMAMMSMAMLAMRKTLLMMIMTEMMMMVAILMMMTMSGNDDYNDDVIHSFFCNT